jgi:pimeloyl-ACP methyl ester carboxylesterase
MHDTGDLRAAAQWPPAGPAGRPMPPPLRLLLAEPVRGVLQMSRLPLAVPWLARAPRGEAHGVLVLPGLLATDMSTRPLRRFLRGLGHEVRGWDLGRNLGPTAEILDGMPRILRDLAERTGSAVSVIGWSLGGIYARELARADPRHVRQVITMGSPFALTDARQSWADGSFRRLSRLHASERVPTPDQVSRPIPVPSTAVYSLRDGIVAWQACVEPPTAQHQNVQVRCAHLGFGVDPATMWLIADRLAQPRHQWAPFRPPRMLRRLYPESR